MKSYYYLSIGSNIHPEVNIICALQELCYEYGETLSFPAVATAPENIKTMNSFVNTIVVISSTAGKHAVKQHLNRIETKLGRDRKDPYRSIKDRTIDIDIIGLSKSLNLTTLPSVQEKYLQAVLSYKNLGDQIRRDILPFDTPSSINIDAGTGDIIIINKVLYPF